MRLLALDMDGTLFRRDGTVCPDDLIAIDRARAAGISVTLCTGRIVTGTLPTALALNLDTPLVCADGALVAHPRTGEVIARLDLDPLALASLTAQMQSLDIAPFWCTHDEIYGEHRGEPYARFVKVWSPKLSLHHKLGPSTLPAGNSGVTMIFGVGERADVEATYAWLKKQHSDEVFSVCFAAMHIDAWTLLARRAGVDKSVGLARVCAELGIGPHEVAVVGDWINDVPMFRWAGRSFVMGSAPSEVTREATDLLRATSITGGGVAEAVELLLGGR